MTLWGAVYTDSIYYSSVSDCAVEPIVPDSSAGLFEIFTSGDLEISVQQSIFNLGKTEYEQWCSDSFQMVYSADDPVIDDPSSSCGVPILEPIVINFTPPVSECTDVSWIYAIDSSGDEVNFDRSRDRAFVNAADNTITIDFKGEDDSTTIDFTLMYADQNIMGHKAYFTLTFSRAAWCDKYATLSLPDNWPDCCTTSYEYIIGDANYFYEVPEF